MIECAGHLGLYGDIAESFALSQNRKSLGCIRRQVNAIRRRA